MVTRRFIQHSILLIVAAFTLVLLSTTPASAQKATPQKATPQPATPQQTTPPPEPRQLNVEFKPWTGDFDSMLTRRAIRVLVPYSRSLYFVDKGHERGITADLARDFEAYLNKRYLKQLGKRPLTVFLVPTTRDKLLSGVADGLGDIAAGNLTATDERRKIVDFVAPTDQGPMKELLVTGPSAPPVATLDDLSGKTLHLRKSTSSTESVQALNRRLASIGRAPVNVVELPAALEDEDVLEMLNAGLIGMTVVDDWKAQMWKQVLPKTTVRADLVLRSDAYPGWAVRKGSPKLVALVTEFHKSAMRLQDREARVAEYYRHIKQINNNTKGASLKRFETTVKLFEKYGARYRFDPLMLAAQGFQESKLRQDAVSHMGAIGVMQIMPPTGKELAVGDITQIEPNIHAGAKYMNRLMTRYFPDAKFSETDRSLFAFACYNAGPGNISKMRRIAVTKGLDQDQWFNNVELITASRIGIETTTYVRNIYKYYVAYKLVEAAQESARKAKEEVVKQQP